MIQCRYERCNCIPCMRCKTKTPDGGRGFSIPIFGRGLISRLTACCRSTCQAICRYNALLHLPKQIQKTMILEPCMHPLSLDWRWQQLHYSIQTTRSPRNLFHEVPFQQINVYQAVIHVLDLIQSCWNLAIFLRMWYNVSINEVTACHVCAAERKPPMAVGGFLFLFLGEA